LKIQASAGDLCDRAEIRAQTIRACLTALQQAKLNGCKLVHINPLPEVGMNPFQASQDVVGAAWQ